MIQKQWIFGILLPGMILAGAMLYLLASGLNYSSGIKEQVVRFHVVAHSDQEVDQQLKIKVRNGVFSLLEELFSTCQNQEEALKTARAHQAELECEAKEILMENGCDAPVELRVGRQFFPTKTYGSLSFPAGNYQAVSLRIGAAEGENFWCVLYPALCLAPAVAAEDAEREMAVAVGEDRLSFLKKADQKQQIRFALVEWFENFRQKYLKS